ncbi:MAG TPA: hypothetical protein VG963_14445, partial [Polyangiaceae bacterium]|nr:hypothetical protein [Polyangiaceae bacterium]
RSQGAARGCAARQRTPRAGARGLYNSLSARAATTRLCDASKHVLGGRSVVGRAVDRRSKLRATWTVLPGTFERLFMLRSLLGFPSLVIATAACGGGAEHIEAKLAIKGSTWDTRAGNAANSSDTTYLDGTPSMAAATPDMASRDPAAGAMVSATSTPAVVGTPTACIPVGTASTPRAQSGDLLVNWTEKHQVMIGFGASDKYHPLLTDQQADLFFSPTAGVGLSMLRVAIDPNGNYIGTAKNSKLAADRGAKVWALPWSPPASWKDNGSTSNGGHLLPAHYADWAARLTKFQDTLMASAGVRLYALSAQNESNYVAKWDSCLYTPEEMTAFLAVLGPLLAQKSPRPLLVSPEAASWQPLWAYTKSIMANPTVASYVDVFSVHQYSGVEAPQTTGRPIWETEYSTFDAATATIENGIAVAQQMYKAIVQGNASAWHYWWLIGQNKDNEGLMNQGGARTKRLYTVGNFSKFVRPGFVRVGTTAGPSGVNVAAFKDECSGAYALVAINGGSATVPFGFAINGAKTMTATPWVTSASLDLRAQPAISSDGGRFSAALPAMSVTTFVGTAG